MANVRILMWNIRFFAESVIKDQTRGTKIVNRVQPAGAAPNFDIFIIIEPNKFTKPLNVGQTVVGSSIKGLQQVFYALHHRDNAWRAVPPRALTCSTNREVHGVFYYSTNVTLVGPDQMVVAPPAALAALGALLGVGGIGMANFPAGVHAWGAAGMGVMTNVGRVRHSPDANPPAANNEVTFPNTGQRRPYMCRFRTTGVNPREFDIYSHHAAPDGDYPANSNGILAFADVHEIGGGRTRPVLITGDFNCCNMSDPCPNKPSSHHGAERRAQWQLIGQQAHLHDYRSDTLLALRAAAAATDLAELAVAAPAPGNVPLAQALAPAVTAAANAATAVANALGAPANANLLLLAAAANGAAANLAGANGGNAAMLAVTARNAAIAVADDLAANYDAPDHLDQTATAVRQTAVAIDQAAVPATAALAVNAVGAAVTAACNDLYGPLVPVAHLAATNAANVASGATGVTPGLVALARAGRDPLLAVVEGQYVTQIKQSLSSLKTDATARPADYRNHAFDHIVTKGFDAEANQDVVDVIAGDAGYGAAAAAPYLPTFQAFYRRLYKGPGSGQNGISDHMPVQITITLN
jgi:hypothetical protein